MSRTEQLRAPTDVDIATRAMSAVVLFEEEGWGGWVELVSYNDKVALFEAARRFAALSGFQPQPDKETT